MAELADLPASGPSLPDTACLPDRPLIGPNLLLI